MRSRCFCVGVTFKIHGYVLFFVTCHCESCRRQCTAPITTYIGVLDNRWRWTKKLSKVFNSSPGMEEQFCDNCGSPLSFRSSKMSGMMHFFASAMEEPEQFEPRLHAAFEEKLPWLKLADQLPRCLGPDYTKASF
jgi:hypothetical protein